MPEHHPETASPSLVGVSYVMPVLNDATHVRAAVESILAQDYAGPVEVLIALGPSIDGTTELVDDIATSDARIKVLENEVGSTPAGLNIAIRAARYPVVMRVDSHSVLPPDYARIAVETLERTGADNVGGIMDAQGETPFERAVALAYRTRVGLGGTPFHVGGRGGTGRHRLPRRASAATRSCASACSTRPSSAARTGSSTGACARPAARSGSRPSWRSPTARGRPVDASPARCSRPGCGAANWRAGSPRRTASGTSSRRSWWSASRSGCSLGIGGIVQAWSGRRRGCSLGFVVPGRLPALRRRRDIRRARGSRCRTAALVSRSLAVHTLLVGGRLRTRLPLADEQHRQAHGKVTRMPQADRSRRGRRASPNSARWRSRPRCACVATPSTGRPRSTCATSRRTSPGCC